MEEKCSAICMQWSENGKCIWNSLYNCCDKPCDSIERFSNDRYINNFKREQDGSYLNKKALCGVDYKGTIETDKKVDCPKCIKIMKYCRNLEG